MVSTGKSDSCNDLAITDGIPYANSFTLRGHGLSRFLSRCDLIVNGDTGSWWWRLALRYSNEFLRSRLTQKASHNVFHSMLLPHIYTTLLILCNIHILQFSTKSWQSPFIWYFCNVLIHNACSVNKLRAGRNYSITILLWSNGAPWAPCYFSSTFTFARFNPSLGFFRSLEKAAKHNSQFLCDLDWRKWHRHQFQSDTRWYA